MLRRSYILVAVFAIASHAFAAEDVSALLKRQTQEFSDAGQKGDTAAMARLLDDNVIFVNEGGDMATKKDMTSGPPPAPVKGVSSQIAVTQWAAQMHGDTAVTTFVDSLTQNFHGQQLHMQFRSVETWKNEAGGWKMIASQTLALQQDPPAVALPPQTLNDYAGTYQAGPGYAYTITRQGNDVMAQVAGGKPTMQKAELRDVLFTPGQPRTRKIFQRDAKGRVTGFVYRREGRDIVFKRVG